MNIVGATPTLNGFLNRRTCVSVANRPSLFFPRTHSQNFKKEITEPGLSQLFWHSNESPFKSSLFFCKWYTVGDAPTLNVSRCRPFAVAKWFAFNERLKIVVLFVFFTINKLKNEDEKPVFNWIKRKKGLAIMQRSWSWACEHTKRGKEFLQIRWFKSNTHGASFRYIWILSVFFLLSLSFSSTTFELVRKIVENENHDFDGHGRWL